MYTLNGIINQFLNVEERFVKQMNHNSAAYNYVAEEKRNGMLTISEAKFHNHILYTMIFSLIFEMRLK